MSIVSNKINMLIIILASLAAIILVIPQTVEYLIHLKFIILGIIILGIFDSLLTSIVHGLKK